MCINVVFFVRCLFPLIICVSPCVCCVFCGSSLSCLLLLWALRGPSQLTSIYQQSCLPAGLPATGPHCMTRTRGFLETGFQRFFFHNFRHLHYIWVVRYQAYLLMQLRHNKNALTLKCQTCKKIKTTIRV